MHKKSAVNIMSFKQITESTLLLKEDSKKLAWC